jgi:hypothetical protein
MNNLALNLKSSAGSIHTELTPNPQPELLTPANEIDNHDSRYNSWSPRALVFLALILVVLQLMDGILTCSGIYAFGISSEGNPILRTLISLLGIIPAVALSKLVCISVVLGLCSQAREIYWLPVALSCVAGIYLVAAVIPWSLLLIGHVFG